MEIIFHYSFFDNSIYHELPKGQAVILVYIILYPTHIANKSSSKTITFFFSAGFYINKLIRILQIFFVVAVVFSLPLTYAYLYYTNKKDKYVNILLN